MASRASNPSAVTIPNSSTHTGVPADARAGRASRESSKDRVAGEFGLEVAIVGMACRFPGADSINAFWHLLESGTNAVTEGVPGTGQGRVGELFPDSVQSQACRFGAYLEDLDQFDAAFFRISPVEAEMMDPQQRLMLETSWRALEDAGIDPERLRGTRTGVYAGISNNEYRGLILNASETAEPAESLYAVTGTSFNTAIGRVSFALGLEGPAIALDTACSSSLVAIHQAVSGLQRGEADLALAGGVHTILSGRLLELRANAGMLSPDGRCATFDAAANGYVRGEGCGIVVLKRLAAAEADGDRIWGVIRGTALNQDGASPGLTVPSAPAQERVIKEALRRAGLGPSEVDYVEAHGTGTEVGDPIEISAAAAAYGIGRPADRPLLIGSVKTNIGHLEAAAGVAGVIKAVLAMKHGLIPKHLHFQTPSPQMDWERMPLRVTATPTEWPSSADRPPRAGVSGFGWSGTNAHVVLEGYGTASGSNGGHLPVGAAQPIAASLPDVVEGPPLAEDGLVPRGTRVLMLSGKTNAALRELAVRYLTWLDGHSSERSTSGTASDPLLADMAWTAASGRSHFGHRAGVVFQDADTLRQGLTALAEEDGRAQPTTATTVAFVYTGQASQWVGMGEALYASEPVVRAVLDRCDALLLAERGDSLLDVMFGRPGAAGELDDPRWKQPAIYALECALSALWSAIGIRPDVVLGHSLGEIAAAHTAGMLGLEDGLRMAAVRGELFGAVPGEGAMGAVFAPASHVAATLAQHDEDAPGSGLCIAADNGAHQAISGPAAEVATVLAHFEAQGIRVARLRKSLAYHSAMIEPALGELEAALSSIAFKPSSLTFVSNPTGRALEPGTILETGYWCQQARQPVKFRDCVERLADLGVDAVIEIGPHGVLGPMTTLAWPEAAGKAEPVVLASLRRPARDEQPPKAGSGGGFADAVAGAYEAGLPLHFPGLFAGEARHRISLPGYPFQRERHWIEAPKRRQRSSGHPLLGDRHDSASGQVAFDTDIFPSDPAWLSDHRVFGRLVAPGALYGAKAATASVVDGSGPAVLEDFQLHNALVFPPEDSQDESNSGGRALQVLLDGSGEEPSSRIQVLSKGASDETWTLHAEGRISPPSGLGSPDNAAAVDLESVRSALTPVDLPAYYRSKASVGIDLGQSFRTLDALWSRPGEALGEVTFPAQLGANGLDIHPLLLDGCFQVMGAARPSTIENDGTTYLPFGWDRLWLRDGLPNRVLCHVRLKGESSDRLAAAEGDPPPEVVSADFDLYDPSGNPIGGLSGFTVKRATRAALLSAVEGLQDLLYEVVWRSSELPPGRPPADFLTAPTAIAAETGLLTAYLANENVGAAERAALLAELEILARAYALVTFDRLGWERVAGQAVEPAALQQRLSVGAEHKRLFRRMLEMLAQAGVLDEKGDGFVVKIGSGEKLPDDLPADPEVLAADMAARFAHGSNEIGLFRRSAHALPQVLRGEADALTLLFSSGEPTAADLYRKAPVARALNRLLADAVASLLRDIPAGRRLRVIEIGAGTGSATASVLPELPNGLYDYAYTDISAGFFSEAESRFGGKEASIDYRVLDIEVDPEEQGFESHGYDLLIASNVLHATRHLGETLNHCRTLLAPSGQLVAIENLRSQRWLDLTFGQLDGWWRFSDDYRPHHALAGPAVWRRALGDAGFGDIAILGFDESDPSANPDRGVIVARGPEQVSEPHGIWIFAADRSGAAAMLADQLAAQNQAVVLAGADASGDESIDLAQPGIAPVCVEIESREAWQSLFEGLPQSAPLAGVVHFVSQDGHGLQATTDQMASDTKRVAASALALAQGMSDADAVPTNGVWLVTKGAQVLETERSGQLAGAALWGFGKVMAREASHLQPRMIDLDPDAPPAPADLVSELLRPDRETHIAYRAGRRYAARLVRYADGTDRITPPEDSEWLLEPDAGGSLDGMGAMSLPTRILGPHDVRVVTLATGLNFWDIFRSIGLIDEGLLGGEFCGRVLETGSEVSTVAEGDLVVGLAFGTFGSEIVTRQEMVAAAPAGFPVADLATMPTAFVSAMLSFDFSGLRAGERVLIHAGAGGVGLAAIQLAQAASAEVFATASVRKRDYLRSLGVKHVYDSRTTAFGAAILRDTGGAGVDVVLNSLTSEGFIEASLSCLAQGGRFVEMARVDILSEEEMAAVRPEVAYHILKLDVLKEHHPQEPGDALRRVMKRLEAGEIGPIVYSRWPLFEASSAMKFMRDARHIGKIVLAASPLMRGSLRQDRTYLVTGGLGGIGCVVAGWLADRGAGTIVLNGRRAPDSDAQETIAAVQKQGVAVRVELADVTDPAALDALLARIDRELPPLGGVIHSVGVLSDASIGNQSWESFQTVLWPKVLGAWHLHKATAGLDLDFFILFSSVAGIWGNPGQTNHSAANAFLDQLAAHRRAIGLPGQAIAWGAWSGLGEAEEQRERIARQLAASGTGWISPQQGLRVFDRLVRQDPATAVAAAVDWPSFGEAVEGRPPLLEDLLADASDLEDDGAVSSDDLLPRLQVATATEREDLLLAFLQQEVQAVLRMPSAPSPTVGFFDLGMDSLMAVELRNRLNRTFSETLVLPNTLVFDYPSIADLAAHLAGDLDDAGGAPPPTPSPEQVQATETRRSAGGSETGIAIVGMACRFPGAPDLSTFWNQLSSATDAVADERREAELWEEFIQNLPTQYSRYGQAGFVEGIDQFDAKFFRISPLNARLLDPQQRMLLETTWEAIEDAGIDADRLKGSCTGVYAGVSSSEYRDLMTSGGHGIGYLNTAASMAVGRVAFQFGLEGPTMPVQLNCASSLIALHHAVAGLRLGETDLALVGGVNAVLSAGVSREMADLRLLSPTGRCRAFDASADGFVRGEGCGMIVLKRLSEAEADGDRIWAVIRGSAFNQNGAAAAATVPNGPAQERLIQSALAQTDLAPSDVDYVEAHGAGSAFGDSIEVQAAAAVYGKGRQPDRPLLMGSVKTNIGHLEPAAGVAGLIKTVLAMQHGVLPPQLHFRNPSTLVDWQQLPVRVLTEATDWPSAPGRPPRAGVSAFGISGVNAHVVLEGYPPSNGTSRERRQVELPEGSSQTVAVSMPASLADMSGAVRTVSAPAARLLPLSAKSGQALRALAGRYLRWLSQHNDQLSAADAASDSLLADMAWTAAVGRSHMGCRAGVVFRDAESLRDGLRMLTESEEDLEPQSAKKVAFAYSDDVRPWKGMLETLYEAEPVFRGVLDRCEQILADERGSSLLDVMFERPEAKGTLDDPAWAQPAAVAVGCALTALWSSAGIRPSAVMGQGSGSGEIAAAQAAGVFELETAMRLGAARGATFGRLAEDTSELATPGDLEAVIENVERGQPSASFVSGVTGRRMAAGEVLDPAYWLRHAVSDSRESNADIGELSDLGIDVIIEIGPDPDSERSVESTWPKPTSTASAPRVLPTFTQPTDSSSGGFVNAVARAYEAGLAVSFEGLFAGEARCRIALPGYPFQRRRFWIPPATR